MGKFCLLFFPGFERGRDERGGRASDQELYKLGDGSKHTSWVGGIWQKLREEKKQDLKKKKNYTDFSKN